MRMILERMKAENFKGIHSLEIDFAQDKTRISGCNGSGKTTIVDAFCWVLWNRSAQGDAPGSDNFREKPLDENGQPVHNLETTVELFCTLDGQRFDLKRKQTENWVKKRGNAEATFQGNVSAYWINGVETKQQDFKERIKAIASDDIAMLIGSLGAFNHLEWKKRRAQLLALAGTDVDGNLLARDEYRQLADEIAERNISPDDLKKVLSDQKKMIKKELEALPIKINEQKMYVSNLSAREIKDAEYAIKDAKETIAEVDRQIINVQAQNSGGTQGRIYALEQKIVDIKHELISDHETRKRRAKAEADAASEEFRRLSALLAETKKDLDVDSERYDTAAAKVEALRERYKTRKRTPVQVNENCPVCGQPLQPDMMEATRARAEQDKRDELEKIQIEGKAEASKMAQYKEYIIQEKERISDLEKRVEAAQTAFEAANKTCKEMPDEPDFAADSRLAEAQKKLSEAKSDQSLTPDEKLRALMERKDEQIARVNRNMEILARRDRGAEAEQRIRGYDVRMQELGAQMGETELLMMQVERFIQDRCGALEESINSHFPTVRWKLFDKQINGGIVDCCEALLDCDGTLVPYSSANSGAQIAADIEIVDALSEYYDIRMPLFVDNAERVNSLPEVCSQTIALSVSMDNELKIEKGR